MEFTPLILAHSAELVGATPWEIFDDPDLFLRAQQAVIREYALPELTAGVFPLCLEGEAYGAKILRDGESSLGLEFVEPIVEEFGEILDLEPFDPQSDGRFGDLIESARILLNSLESGQVYVPISGPFTVAAQLMGQDEFLSQFLSDPELAMQALQHLTEGQCALCEEISLAGLGVRIIDTGAASPALIQDETFNDVAVPILHKLVARARNESALPVILQLAGNLSLVAESLVEIGPHVLACPPSTAPEQLIAMLQRLNQNGHGHNFPETVRVDIPGTLFRTHRRKKLEHWLDKVLPLLAGSPAHKVSVGTTALPLNADPALVKMAKQCVQNS